jgi:hypothetical protein
VHYCRFRLEFVHGRLIVIICYPLLEEQVRAISIGKILHKNRSLFFLEIRMRCTIKTDDISSEPYKVAVLVGGCVFQNG